MRSCGKRPRMQVGCYSESMRISVIVPAFNEAWHLASTLDHIRTSSAAFERAGWAVELIVCDNNSTDATAAIAAAAGAHVIFEPINQISRARNAGASAASGDWLIFVDADSHPSAELFEAVAAQIRGGRCLAGGSTITFGTRQVSVRLAAWAWNTCSRVTRWAAGSFIFCERAAFLAAGGFSLSLFAAEEIDLFRRLKRRARTEHRTIVILRAHPLWTSDRKARLYSLREWATFMRRTILARGATLRSAGQCYAWYDGRREDASGREGRVQSACSGRTA